MRSSISNSDPARPWPKSHNAVLAILLAFTWMAAAALLNGLDPYPKPRVASLGGSAALGSDTRLLVVGTSHVLDGVRPSLLGPHAMNLALSGGDYRAILLVLRHRLADMPNLETVVLEADNLCLLQSGVDRKDFSEFYAWGLSRNDLPLSWRAKRWQAVVEQPLIAPFIYSRRLTPGSWSRVPQLELTIEPGFQSTEQRVSAGNSGPAIMRLHERMIADAEIAPNLDALKELLHLLKARKIQVVLLTLPHHRGYRSSASDRWQKTFDDILAVARSVLGDDMVWWNLESHPGFTDEDFMDGHHLNVVGASKMSEWLRESLANLDKN